jgi:hypothetical protein
MSYITSTLGWGGGKSVSKLLPSICEAWVWSPAVKKKVYANYLDKFIMKLPIMWVLVTHACNPNYLGGWDWKMEVWRQSTQKLSETPYLNQWLGTVACTCHPMLQGRLIWGLWFQVSLGKKICKVNRKKLGVVVCTWHPSDSRRLFWGLLNNHGSFLFRA